MLRPSPPLLSSLPPTIRAILNRGHTLTDLKAPPRLSPPSTSASPSSTPLNAAPAPALTAQPAYDAKSDDPSSVTVRGWVKSVRAHARVSFAAIADGSGPDVLQAVFKAGAGAKLSEEMTVGSSVELTGQLRESRGKGQALELSVQSAKLVGACDPETYPIQKKKLSEKLLRHNAHLRFRTTQSGSIMRIRDSVMRDFHDWFEENEFVHVHTPILTSSDCEGAGEVFTLRDGLHASSLAEAQLLDSAQLPASPEPPNSTVTTSPSPSSSISSSPTSTPKGPQRPRSFFPHPVNLTVSSQLHLECPTHSLSRTYTLSPSFRAEPSMTSRHLSEFYMLEAELAGIEHLDQLLDVVEGSLKGTLAMMLDGTSKRAERTRDDLRALQEGETTESEESGSKDAGQTQPDLRKILEEPFKRMTYTQAISALERLNQERPDCGIPSPQWGEGLPSESERWLAKDGPVFITHYPAAIKPFYMLPSAAENSSSSSLKGNHNDVDESAGTSVEPLRSLPTVACFDLLMPGMGELIGGSLREHRYDHLLRAIQAHKLDPGTYEWYLDLRRFGSVPHGGWGMGWERWIAYITGTANVRDVVAFPRWVGHCRY